MRHFLRSGTTSNGVHGLASPVTSGLYHLTNNYGQTGQQSETQARTRGRSSVIRDRCGWCIANRKGYESAKPVCGNCRKKPERCHWPVGNHSRSGLGELRISPRPNEDNPQHSGINTVEEGSISNIVAGAQLTTNNALAQEELVPLSQVFKQVERTMSSVVLRQQLPVEDQVPGYSLQEMQRLDQVRVRVLEGTRVYLGYGPQLPVVNGKMD
ncbi:uncharacterized protein Z518_00261 [Rhinocladiella mackenziei CBS 650.93]|uniref:Zn(2)-C6 fungal-type domain-containing protein n=1 Tax=Rhinocladiella mackenziei CBS 650.93 TaxID=1442369 RepID=A0A0D2G3L1_9EURO|nr:uncharacterized protein Z518_00261 [Rhinocladiella mackenziei CBS 650.93]KIX09182.1 hypothetical protein Z518_00261 [Rhinocladiella mackenziei CBS 650.93]